MIDDQHRNFFDKICIGILEKSEYTIESDFQIRNFYSHLPFIFLSIGMFCISFFSVGTIKNYVFIFHILSIGKKWITLVFNKRNCEINRTKKSSSTKRLKITSPYHTQFKIYTYEILMLLFVSTLSVLKIQNIDRNVVYSIVVYLSILISFLQEVLDEMVIMYNAKANVRRIV